MSETPPTAPTAEAHGAAAAPENTLASAPERAPEHSLDGAPEAAPHDAPAAAAPRAPELGPAQVGALLAERFPALFGAGRALPIKLRIQADIQQRAPGLLSKKSLSIFLHRHTTSTPYLKALVALPQRIDLDGAPAGEIAAEHRAAAAAELERRRALLEARRAAERQLSAQARAAARPAAPPAAAPGEGASRHPPGRSSERQRPPPRRRDTQPRTPMRPPRPPQGSPAAAEAAAPAPGPEDAARRERALLLRAYEASTLTKANFCVLKRIAEAELDAALAQARAERPGNPAPVRPPR